MVENGNFFLSCKKFWLKVFCKFSTVANFLHHSCRYITTIYGNRIIFVMSWWRTLTKLVMDLQTRDKTIQFAHYLIQSTNHKWFLGLMGKYNIWRPIVTVIIHLCKWPKGHRNDQTYLWTVEALIVINSPVQRCSVEQLYR